MSPKRKENIKEGEEVEREEKEEEVEMEQEVGLLCLGAG